MSKDRYPCILSRQIEAIVFVTVQLFCNAREKMFTTGLLFAAWHGFLYNFMNKIMFTFFYNNHKTLSHLELNC